MQKILFRQFFASFVLPPESQQIDRVLNAFANQYVEENPSIFLNIDSAHICSFALVLLNSDIHNPNQAFKMTKSEFIRNTRMASTLIPEEILNVC